MDDPWTRLETWLRRHQPDLLASFRPPAAEAALAQVEAHLNAPLPPAFRRLYARHDGQAEGWTVADNWRLLPLAEALESGRLLTELLVAGEFEAAADPAAGVRAVWWSAGWLPFGDNGAGDHLCLDLDPAPNGVPGQLVEFWHADPDRPRAAVSIEAWLKQIVDELEAGSRAFDPEYGGLMTR